MPVSRAVERSSGATRGNGSRARGQAWVRVRGASVLNPREAREGARLRLSLHRKEAAPSSDGVLIASLGGRVMSPIGEGDGLGAQRDEAAGGAVGIRRGRIVLFARGPRGSAETPQQKGVVDPDGTAPGRSYAASGRKETEKEAVWG